MLSNPAIKSTLCLAALFATVVRCQDKADFFYSDLLDTCAYNDVSMPASNNTANGGLCAWVSATNRVYACPATDSICWTWYQTCGSGTTASSDQILCSNAGATWCCPNTDTCTILLTQINVCISKFNNPNANMQPGPAESVELQVLGISSVASTIATASPIATASQSFFSTITLSSNASSSSTSSPSFSSSSTPSASTSSSTFSASITSTGGSPVAASASASAGATVPNSISSLSGGAIAGIVIGVLAVVALVAATIIFLMQKRWGQKHGLAQQHGELHANSGYGRELPGDSSQHYQQKERKSHTPNRPMVEADSGIQRPELP